MKLKLILLGAMAFTLCGQSSFADTLYGKDFITPRGGELMVTDAISELQKSKKKVLKNVVIQGEVGSVCKQKGCWISLKTGAASKANSCEEVLKPTASQSEVRVMFKGHSIAAPKDLSGTVVVSGDIKKKKLSKFQLRHFLKDAGCTKKQIKSVKNSVYKYQITATGMRVL